MPTKRPSSSAPPEPGSNRRASQDSQPSTQSRIMKRWTPNEEIYLIAAIDYCIDNDVSPEHAIPAILADVQQNSEGTRSWGSIVSKIRSLNEKFHVNKTFAVHPLLEKGSKCLNLSSEMRKAVKVARDSIIQRLEPISPENSPSDGSFFHPSENDADAALSISVVKSHRLSSYIQSSNISSRICRNILSAVEKGHHRDWEKRTKKYRAALTWVRSGQTIRIRIPCNRPPP